MVDIRPILPADEEAWLAGLSDGPSPAEWAWRQAAPALEDAGTGARRMGAFEGERILAQAALVPARVSVRGEDRIVSELVEFRGADAPDGVWAQVVTALLDENMGLDGDLVVHGWLPPAEWTLAKGPCKFEVVRTQTVLSRPAGAGPTELPQEVRVLERFDHQARWLFDRCAGAFDLSTIRDESFLNWRFFERPGRDYEALGVFDGDGVLRGYAVLTAGHI